MTTKRSTDLQITSPQEVYEATLATLLDRDSYRTLDSFLAEEELRKFDDFFANDADIKKTDPQESAQERIDETLRSRFSTVNAVGNVALFSDTIHEGERSTLAAVGLSGVIDEIEAVIEIISKNALVTPRERGRIATAFLGKPKNREPRHQKVAKAEARSSQVDRLIELLSSLNSHPEEEILGRLHGQHFIDAARISAKSGKSDNKSQNKGLPTREQRIARYRPGERSKPLELSGKLSQPTPPSEIGHEHAKGEISVTSGIKKRFIRGQLRSVPVEMFTGGQVDVTLFKAMSPRVEKIAQKLHRGRKNADGLDKYQHEAHKVARRIAGGIMPWESRNSVKRATLGKDESESIWYTFEISPNSPRVYFTVKIKNEEGGTTSVDLIVVGETDKQHQLDVLAQLTGKSKPELKAQGAGSI